MDRIMTVDLRAERDLEVARNGSEGHPIRERASLGLFLGLSDVEIDEKGQVKGFVLKNAPNYKYIKIRNIIATTSTR